MFGIDRNDGRPLLGSQPHDVLAPDDQRFLIGQSQLLACLKRRYRRRQTGITDQRIDHDIGIACRGNLRHSIGTRIHLDIGIGQSVAERSIITFVGDDDRCNVESLRLLSEPFPITMSRERHDLETIGIIPYDVERLHADRTGRSQNSQTLFHTVPAR